MGSRPWLQPGSAEHARATHEVAVSHFFDAQFVDWAIRSIRFASPRFPDRTSRVACLRLAESVHSDRHGGSPTRPSDPIRTTPVTSVLPNRSARTTFKRSPGISGPGGTVASAAVSINSTVKKAIDFNIPVASRDRLLGFSAGHPENLEASPIGQTDHFVRINADPPTA